MGSCNNFVALLWALSCLLATTSAEDRISNGRPENITNSPYTVALLSSGTYFCAGSLLSMKLVITAAHCLIAVKANDVNILAGTTDLRQLGQRRRVLRMWYSSSYEVYSANVDIGAILVRTPFNPNPLVATISLCSTTLSPGIQMRVTGWGRTAKNEPTVNELRTATITILSHDYCANQFKNDSVLISDAMVCAGNGVRSSCDGDSGAPGVVNRQLCGVESFAYACASTKYPDVFVNVNNPLVRSFITDAMKE